MRLGIDLDGVVADFNTGWVGRYNREFDANLTTDMVDSWDAMGDITHFETLSDFWQWAENGDGPSIFRHLPPYPNALQTLHRLAAHHRIVIISAKFEWALHDTFAWIADNKVPTREVHITCAKWRVPCDVYLDDSPHQIVELHENRAEAVVCRFVRPWNEPVIGVSDVASWDEFEALVDQHRC